MATPTGYNYVSPGLYRSPTGQTVRRSQIPQAKPTPTTTTTAAPAAPTYATTFQRTGNGMYRNSAGKLFSGETIDAYTKRFNSVANRFSGMKQEDADYNTLGTKLQNWGKQFGFDTSKLLGKDWKPYQAPAAPAPTEPTAETTPAAPAADAAPATMPEPTFQYQQSPMTAALLEAMKGGLNTMQAYEPKFYEGSPLYQFQKQQGSKDLERLMAARGLTGSGAEVQANSDFLSKLNADESEKARQYAEQAANRQQTAMQFLANFDQEERDKQLEQWNKNTDRQLNMQEFDTNRADRRNELATQFLTNILGMQAQNPIATQAQSGLDSQTALTKALTQMMGSFTANNYPRSYGGGGGTPPVPPTGGNAQIMKTLMDYGNRAGNNDLLDGFLRMFSGR
jgi:hypothetical protein